MSDAVMELAVKLFCQTYEDVILRSALAAAGDEDLTGVQFACLRFIHLHREPSVGSVAEGLGISNAATTKLLHRLVLKGLLERREDPADRRVLKLELTKAGEELVGEIQKAESEAFARVFARMPPEARESLWHGLTAFLEAALVAREAVDLVCQRCGWSHIPACPGNQVYQKLTGQERKNV